MEVWSWTEYEGIRWLNEPEKLPKGKGWEIAIVNDCFDPDGGTEKFYSHPVILITVPKLVDRDLTVGK